MKFHQILSIGTLTPANFRSQTRDTGSGTVYIFPGKVGENEFPLFAQKSANKSMTASKYKIPSLCMPTEGLKREQGNTFLQDLWRAVGFGCDVAIEVKGHAQTSGALRYFPQALTNTGDDAVAMEPLWKGEQNVPLARRYFYHLEYLNQKALKGNDNWIDDELLNEREVDSLAVTLFGNRDENRLEKLTAIRDAFREGRRFRDMPLEDYLTDHRWVAAKKEGPLLQEEAVEMEMLTELKTVRPSLLADRPEMVTAKDEGRLTKADYHQKDFYPPLKVTPALIQQKFEMPAGQLVTDTQVNTSMAEKLLTIAEKVNELGVLVLENTDKRYQPTTQGVRFSGGLTFWGKQLSQSQREHLDALKTVEVDLLRQLTQQLVYADLNDTQRERLQALVPDEKDRHTVLLRTHLRNSIWRGLFEPKRYREMRKVLQATETAFQMSKLA